jgi:hypothetical protein
LGEVTERVGALGQVRALVVLEQGGPAERIFDALHAAEVVVEELGTAGDERACSRYSEWSLATEAGEIQAVTIRGTERWDHS